MKHGVTTSFDNGGWLRIEWDGNRARLTPKEDDLIGHLMGVLNDFQKEREAAHRAANKAAQAAIRETIARRKTKAEL